MKLKFKEGDEILVWYFHVAGATWSWVPAVIEMVDEKDNELPYRVYTPLTDMHIWCGPHSVKHRDGLKRAFAKIR